MLGKIMPAFGNAENVLAFGNADKKLSISFLAYPIGCEVWDANAVLR
jgi:hypothetical protein